MNKPLGSSLSLHFKFKVEELCRSYSKGNLVPGLVFRNSRYVLNDYMKYIILNDKFTPLHIYIFYYRKNVTQICPHFSS